MEQTVNEDQSLSLRMTGYRTNSRAEGIRLGSTIYPVDCVGLQIEATDAIGRSDLGIRIPGVKVSELAFRREDLALVQRMPHGIKRSLSQALRRRQNPLGHIKNIIAICT